jgi:hypothetical protein
MDATELHAKAVIAAALIASHAVEIPNRPRAAGHWTTDASAVRLRELTEYVYHTLTDEMT